MRAITNITDCTKQVLFPTKRIKNGISKQFDKSSFDELIQLLKFLPPHPDNIIHLFKLRNGSFLF